MRDFSKCSVQFLQNFTKSIRKLKKMDGLCYFKSFIVFGPGTFRLYLVYVRNRKRLKSCREDLNIININDTFLYVGLGEEKWNKQLFITKTMHYIEIFSSVKNENFMRKNDILKF